MQPLDRCNVAQAELFPLGGARWVSIAKTWDIGFPLLLDDQCGGNEDRFSWRELSDLAAAWTVVRRGRLAPRGVLSCLTRQKPTWKKKIESRSTAERSGAVN